MSSWTGDRERRDEPVAITSALDGVLRSLRGPDRHRVGGVFGRWDELVGPAVAAHVRPVRLDGGTLLVEVDDPSWATQLTFVSDDLRARLRTGADLVVDRLEVRVARGAGRGGRAPRGAGGAGRRAPSS